MKEEVFLIDGKDSGMLKIAIAKELYNKGYEQTKISKLLGITQPMVSRLLVSRDDVPKNVIKNAKIIVERVIKKNKLKIYTVISFNDILEGEHYIADKEDLMTDEKKRIIENLSSAYDELKEVSLGSIMPKVKMNIAMSTQDAKDKKEVASFSNGLMISNDMLTVMPEIRFGKSNHLSELLLYLKSKDNSINSIMNIRYDAKLKGQQLSKSYKVDKLKNHVLLHKGDFGIEPCAYVIGKDATDVVNKVKEILA